jgi:hypothetical protein
MLSPEDVVEVRGTAEGQLGGIPPLGAPPTPFLETYGWNSSGEDTQAKGVVVETSILSFVSFLPTSTFLFFEIVTKSSKDTRPWRC